MASSLCAGLKTTCLPAKRCPNLLSFGWAESCACSEQACLCDNLHAVHRRMSWAANAKHWPRWLATLWMNFPSRPFAGGSEVLEPIRNVDVEVLGPHETSLLDVLATTCFKCGGAGEEFASRNLTSRSCFLCHM